MSPIITNQTINPDYLLIYSQLWVVFRCFVSSSFRLASCNKNRTEKKKNAQKKSRIDLIGSLYSYI